MSSISSRLSQYMGANRQTEISSSDTHVEPRSDASYLDEDLTDEQPPQYRAQVVSRNNDAFPSRNYDPSPASSQAAEHDNFVSITGSFRNNVQAPRISKLPERSAGSYRVVLSIDYGTTFTGRLRSSSLLSFS